MTEWPDSWRVLACCPELVEILAADDPEAALADLDVALLPDRLPRRFARSSGCRQIRG